MNVTVGQIAALQGRQSRIRNMCIMAHVDHGKTTLSDHLIGSNGLIHPKMMGELRYLDSRDDEQARGITMKSSSISLLYVPGASLRPQGAKSCTAEEKVNDGYLVNLIDSPGHVDFCSEVSTAARLCDGALVVVDAVEGVCIQTHAVLRQAWEEKVKPCLFLNKMDRLVMELRMTPAEAHQRMQQIITHVNMIWSAFQSEKYISEADAVLAYEEARVAASEQQGGEEGEGAAADEDEEDLFQPAKGNVAFGSAHDGWAFRVDQFADMYAEKLGCKAEALCRALWGDYSFLAKERRVVRATRKGASKLKAMFVQFALEPIWKAYTACEPGEDPQAVLAPIIKGRGLAQVTQKMLDHPDARQVLRSVLRAWLPLSEAVLGMAVTHLPSPAAASPERMPKLLALRQGAALSADLPPAAAEELARVESHLMASSSSSEAPLVVFVSKMISVPVSLLPRLPGEPAPASGLEERFLAFGRVFSGVAREGQRVHVLSAAYDPSRPGEQRQSAVLGQLYLMMGRGLERLQEVPAGNVLAIGGLDTAILKSATLCSAPTCRPLAPMTFQAAPIVRVAVEPARPHEMPALIEGLRLLNRADPFVEVSVMDTGEHVLGAAGEVHLETCIKDLQERFAKVELQVSPPLVAFRETVQSAAEAPEGSAVKAAKVVEVSTPSGCCVVRVRTCALPAGVAAALDDHADVLRSRAQGSRARHSSSGSAAANGAAANGASSSSSAADDAAGVVALRTKLESVCADSGAGSKALAQLRKAWLLGPKQIGPNALLAADGTGEDLFDVPASLVVKTLKSQLKGGISTAAAAATAVAAAGSGSDAVAAAAAAAAEASSGDAGAVSSAHLDVHLGRPQGAALMGLVSEQQLEQHSVPSSKQELPGLQHVMGSIESGLVSAFQMATAAGPLCDEPMWGVAFEVCIRVSYTPDDSAAEGAAAGGAPRPEQLALQEDVYGPFSGQVMTAVAGACRRAVMESDPRLVEAMYLCQVQASAEALSGVYAVLGRRRARVLSEELREGSDQFVVHAYLPVEASFGLADEMRRRSSGAASVSLLLSHWERLQVDPFFVPTTEEEREEWGEEALGANLAKKMIDAVRRRKGLPVEEKVVAKATKQRTLKRNV